MTPMNSVTIMMIDGVCLLFHIGPSSSSSPSSTFTTPPPPFPPPALPSPPFLLPPPPPPLPPSTAGLQTTVRWLTVCSFSKNIWQDFVCECLSVLKCLCRLKFDPVVLLSPCLFHETQPLLMSLPPWSRWMLYPAYGVYRKTKLR